MRYQEFLENNPPVFIYGLVDPETDLIRYVGKSIRPEQRLSDHMNDRSKCHRSNWLQSLKSRGLKPGIFFLERIVGAWPWQESERFWIRHGRRNGWPLTNNTDGGDGVSGLPEETRKRMRMTWLGRKHRSDSLIKIGEASRGRKHSNETKKRMSMAHSGRVITWGSKISDATRKISSEGFDEIKRRLGSGEKVKDLAAEFGVHRTTLSKIKTGVYFK